jgi:hypothetical protein
MELDRRMHGPIVRSFELNFRLRGFNLKRRKDLELLILFGWKLEEQERNYLFLLVSNHWIKYQQPEEIAKLRAMLYSKVVCYEILSRTWSASDFFGNVLPKLLRIEKSFEAYLQEITPKKPRRLIRRRGYRDHGTLLPSHQWKPRKDWTLTELQNHLEEISKEYDDLYRLIVGMYI